MVRAALMASIAVTSAGCSSSKSCEKCPDNTVCISGECLVPCLAHTDCAVDELCFDGGCTSGHLRPGDPSLTPGDTPSDGAGDAGGGGDPGGGDPGAGGDSPGDPAVAGDDAGDPGGGGDVLPGTCGNNEVEGDEVCDGTDLAGRTACSDFSWQGGGPVTCMLTCMAYDLSACTGAPGNCGTGSARGLQQCDGGDVRGLTCEDLGFSGGDLTCNDNCTLNVTACTL